VETDYVKLLIFPIIVEAESLFSCDMETKYNFATVLLESLLIKLQLFHYLHKIIEISLSFKPEKITF